jgi:Dna[CI] antecedent, DciA
MDRTRDPDLAARLFGARPEHTLALLRTSWPAAVGPELARRTEVVALDRGVLRVKVPDLRWQRTLLRMRGDILSRLRAVAGGVAPRGIGFVVGPVAEVPAPPHAAPEGPPAPAPPAVAEAAAAIPDPEIRARFLAAAARYLHRFAPAQGSGGSGPGTG